jgi:uncharacterized membrane protein
VPPVITTRAGFITHTALYLAIAIILPIGFHAVGMGGRIFLPMHIPVLLAGLVVGPLCGIIVGLLAPGLSTILTGLPPVDRVLFMSMELAMYGLVGGLAYRVFQLNLLVSLILAMIMGRLMFGLGLFLLALFVDVPYSAAAFFSIGGAMITGWPGVVIQLILVPLVVKALERRSQRPRPAPYR